MAQTLLLELNEVNFDAIEFYAARGRLPTFARLISDHGITQTTSEAEYENLEPWIQWVTAHTGKTLAEHGVFRLGDITQTDLPQIWEQLEAEGLTVGAISPMNAKNRTSNAAFFVPDPWTPTSATGSPLLRRLGESISKMVNANAKGGINSSSAAWLLVGAARYARARNYGRYLMLGGRSLKLSWTRAMVLDMLLADAFIGLVKDKRPNFASLFLNAAAHIQHHYLFSSPVYPGANPEWYVAKGADPLLEVYETYDQILADIMEAFPQARLMIATGLHQKPHANATYYWRLKDHDTFLRRIGVPFKEVQPRMSRDFYIICHSREEAERARDVLESVVEAETGAAMFEVDLRGDDLFVMLVWDRDIGAKFSCRVGNQDYSGLREDVAFVAIKNGEHDGIGYLIDTGLNPSTAPSHVPLSSLPDRVKATFQSASPS